MKVKTYGKKSNQVPNAFFEDSSPLPDAKHHVKSPLVETSDNVRRLKPKANASKLQPVTGDGKEEDGNGGPKKDGLRSNCTAKPKGTSTQAQLVDENLVPSLQNLSFSDVGIRSKVDIDLLPTEPSIPPICQRPAQVDDDTQTYASPLLQCKNVCKCIEDFHSWMAERNSLLEIEKIGEGSFGEVYRARGNETVILKLMPLNAKAGKGSRSYTSIESATNELRLLQRMQKVPGFVEFRGACVLQGRMPKQLVAMWNEYKKSGRTVESKDPNKRSTYPANQLWLLIEMSDAGRNLNPGQYIPAGRLAPVKGASYLSVHQTWDIFWQIVKALAKAEIYSHFEHRDLHLGNICVKETSLGSYTKVSEDHHGSSQGFFGLNNTGIEVTLIDYSLSRAFMGNKDDVLFYDLQKDKALLNGQGDYQYDIYRYMAKLIGERSCRTFDPRTNVLWLHYVLQMLLQVTYTTSPDGCRREAAVRLEKMKILENLDGSLRPEVMKGWMTRSAGDLLDMGLAKQWFLPVDIVDS